VKKGSNTLLFYFYRKEDGEKLEDNKRHLMNITQKVFNAIVESALSSHFYLQKKIHVQAFYCLFGS
jgi:hypothetical protein